MATKTSTPSVTYPKPPAPPIKEPNPIEKVPVPKR
jgi:hypothetical protein